MGRDGSGTPENPIARAIVDSAVKVHRTLGAGMLESAYKAALGHELRRRGFDVRTEVAIDIFYEDLVILGAYRADVVVDERVLIELKSVARLLPQHKAQVLTYLRFSGLRLGILLNFGAPVMKDGIKRIVNGL